MRLDHLQRPELNKGTVDFVVPEEYWAINPPPKISSSYYLVQPPPPGPRRPQPMDYVFVFDISNEAIQSGFLVTACASLLKVLYGGTSEDGLSLEPCFPENSRLAIISFDQTLHFYNLSVRLLQSIKKPADFFTSAATFSTGTYDGTTRHQRDIFTIARWATCSPIGVSVSASPLCLHPPHHSNSER